jgi:hypothetical protein
LDNASQKLQMYKFLKRLKYARLFGLLYRSHKVVLCVEASCVEYFLKLC